MNYLKILKISALNQKSKNNPLESLDLKNTVTEIKNLLDG